MTPVEKCHRDALIALAGMVHRLSEAQIRLARGEAASAKASLYDMDDRLRSCLADLDRLVELRGEPPLVFSIPDSYL